MALPDVPASSLAGIVHILIVGVCVVGAMMGICVFGIVGRDIPDVFPSAILIGIGYLVGANAVNAVKNPPPKHDGE